MGDTHITVGREDSPSNRVLSALVALLKGDEMDTDIHIHDSKIYPTDNWEYYSYLNEYNQKYDIKSKSESHIRSMEPEEVE